MLSVIARTARPLRPALALQIGFSINTREPRSTKHRCVKIRIVTGRDRLACMHLTAKPTLRWYAECCGTPMFNTYRSGRVPYVTTVVANCDPDWRGSLLGEPIGHLFTEEATGDASHLRRLSMFKLMRRFSRRMMTDIISGDRRRDPLFDPATLEPFVSPIRIVG